MQVGAEMWLYKHRQPDAIGWMYKCLPDVTTRYLGR